MEYLERNISALAEISGNVKLFRGPAVAETMKTRFHALGSFQSEVFQREVWLGLHASSGFGMDMAERAERGLTLFHIIASNLPHRVTQLPLFYGLVRTPNEEVIVTEDFSRGGQLLVAPQPVVPSELVNLLTGRFDIDNIDSLCFKAGEETKVGDVEVQFRDSESMGLWMEMMEEIDRYTIDINYPLDFRQSN